MPVVVNVNNLTGELRKRFDALTSKQVARAASASINKVLKSDRVMIAREIRRIYQMNVFDSKSQIEQKLSTINTLRGTLSGDAGFTPFEYFKVSGENSISGSEFKVKRRATYSMINGKKKVVGRSTDAGGEGRHATFTVSMIKGHSSLFTHAFLATTKNGPMLFNRGSYNSRTNVFGSVSPRLPMDRLRSLSVWQEINSKQIVGKTDLLLRQEYGRELYRLMNLQLKRGGWN